MFETGVASSPRDTSRSSTGEVNRRTKGDRNSIKGIIICGNYTGGTTCARFAEVHFTDILAHSSNDTARVSRGCVRGRPHETKGFTGVWSHYPARAIQWTKGLGLSMHTGSLIVSV